MKFLNNNTLIILVILLVFTQIECLQKKHLSKVHKKHLKHKNLHKHHHKWIAPEAIPAELPDVSQNGMHDFAEILELFKNHHLTVGEIKIIFRTADLNEDNRISYQEWADFHALFIEPFEDADGSGDYLIGKNPVLYALQTGWFQAITDYFNKSNGDELIECFDRWNQDSEINFADYLFLRKANLAWKECASEDGIGQKNMNCALKITSPQKTLQSVEASEVFKLANVIREGKQIGSKSIINFLEFLTVAHLYYYFTEFELPFVDTSINKKDVIRAIDEGALPTTLNPQQVNQIFTRNLEVMDFKAFGGSLYAFRLFARFGQEIPGAMSEAEWQDCLAIHNFNQPLLNLIDNLYMPTQDEIDKAALFRLGKPKSEKDYIMHFLEVNKKVTKHHKRILTQKNHRLHHALRFSRLRRLKYHAHVESESKSSQVPIQQDDSFDEHPRTIIYRQFDSSLAGQMTYGDFQHFLKYSWMFQNYDTDNNGRLTDTEIMIGQKDQVQVIPLDVEEYRDHAEIQDWLAGHKDFTVNIKQFCAYFRYIITFRSLKSTGMSVHAIQYRLHQGFRQLGFRVAKSTENLNHDGYNNLLNEREFHFKRLFVQTVEDEAIAISIKSGSYPTQEEEERKKKKSSAKKN